MSEHTILDFYGTPYGGERGNFNSPVRHGGSGYEDAETPDEASYGDELSYVAWYGRNNVSGPA